MTTDENLKRIDELESLVNVLHNSLGTITNDLANGEHVDLQWIRDVIELSAGDIWFRKYADLFKKYQELKSQSSKQ